MTYLGRSRVMGVLKQVPEMPLSRGAGAGAEVLLRLPLRSGLGQQPPEVMLYRIIRVMLYHVTA